MKKKFTKKEKQLLKQSRKAGTALFAVFLLVGTLTGLVWFARPAVSALEKRELTQFPAFTLGSFLDGSWFSQISSWYSDTYPGRDSLMAMNRNLQKLYGIRQDTVLVGGTAKADEIGGKDSEEQDPDDSENTVQYDERKEAPDASVLQEDIQAQIVEGLLIQDGAAYAGYYFNQDSYDTYTRAVEKAAQELEGTTQVWSILIPNNSGVVLDEADRNALGGSDQKQAIDYYYTNYSDRIRSVGTIDTLRDHADEYLYFRSDHHWTQRAAYYVYANLARLQGWEPVSLDDWQREEFSPFLGSYASELPTTDFREDSLECWVPADGNTMKILDGDYANPDSTQYREHPIVNLDENIDMYSQYMRFIGGDNPMSIIDNPKINDGSSCLVVKESYGNAFIPWLTAHYDKVYVADFRYCDVPLVTFCKEQNINDLYLINNIQLIASPTVADRYAAILQ